MALGPGKCDWSGGALRASEEAVRGISGPLKGVDALLVQAVQWPSARHRSWYRASGVRGQGAVGEVTGPALG